HNKGMPHHRAARPRLVALWVAVAAFAAGVGVVTTFAFKLGLDGDHGAYRPEVMASWLALAAVPVLIVSPLIGAVARTRWPRAVLATSTVVALSVVGWGYVTPDAAWLGIAGLLALPAAVFGCTALALLPSAAEAARLRLPSVLVAIALAAFAGLLLGFDLGIDGAGGGQPPLGAHYALVVLALAGFAGLMADFPVSEPSTLAQGWLRPYVTGVRDAVRHRRARRGLVGLWLWGFVTLATVLVLTRLGGRSDLVSEPSGSMAVANSVTLGIAVLGGILFAGLNRHAYRHAWAIPYAVTIGLACLLWLRFGHAWQAALLGIGLALGATFSPLLNSYLTWTTPKYHGAGGALLVAGWCVAALALAGLLRAFGPDPDAARDSLLNVLVAAAALGAVGAWFGFFRPAVEGTMEIAVEIMYRVRSAGPDAERLPARGPYLVIANHAAWLDPLWMAQVLPAPITPMMTSKFYDLPVIAWLMRHVIRTIRVPDVPYRHEAPELQEAIRRLDRGECVVLFPEGYLRRKEEVPLRRFGRGVWKILSDRPQTPVFACWIEGGWGSYFSFKGGPPTKGKRPDFRRPIRIGVTGPFTVDPATLADHMATRMHLMERVNAARPLLGLEPLALAAAPEGDKE
ncbi:MAG TPA: 1-acyl-sn-glycerol-3-phosphate acyltransferase, partial [Gemmataceae bacterium]|nr:1-acyl-sn-glycerol-3-phosphate acyltransferase [Gemmataceae bacterium]